MFAPFYISPPQKPEKIIEHTPDIPKKSRFIVLLLVLFLGPLGIHKFYLGNKKAGYLYLFFFWTLIPGIFSIVECIYYFFITEKKLNQKIQARKTTFSLV